MSTADDKVAAVVGMMFFLLCCGVIIWHLASARKTGRIFRFSKIPIGGSAFITKTEDPDGFLFASIVGYVLSVALATGAILIFLAAFFPSSLRNL